MKSRIIYGLFTFTTESDSFLKWHLDPQIKASSLTGKIISSNLSKAYLKSVDPSASANRTFSPKLANIP